MPFYALTYELLDTALTICKPVIMRIKYHKGNRRFTDAFARPGGDDIEDGHDNPYDNFFQVKLVFGREQHSC